MFKIGVDDFSYHRFYGWIIPGQSDPGKRWTHDEFIERATELKLDAVSMETCFMPGLERSFLEELRAKLEDRAIEGMLSWGHPRGLETGKNREAAEGLKRFIELAPCFGNNTVRIVGGGLADRNEEPIRPQIDRIIRVLKEIVEVAAEHDLTLAMENHMDFTADEQIEILEAVGSPYLKVLLDTGNNLRLLEDPIEVVKKLAPYAVATHVKDITATGRGSPAKEWRKFWPSVPLGKGIIDLPQMLKILKENNYRGSLNVEIDFLDPGWPDDDRAVEESIEYLRKINI
ncbi:MAG: sugar phosphate isomerase/epimerase [Deltaproteobacteria bacterium]|nr:sugar phosphate isomerase/epimerase [Deltaproteobacteria bacterium]MBW1961426.1 sugar phosphate isomerase/epimerase [Deltaproteobacteria bacterium]MBW1993480.1 sugar phosphate isomerase/epimerase [Deltaproteobacteria bacterium]MBW2153221.1 sugar phosphate isomerase/epimerase [Deltaproteobacteria bacterium]